jgi:hypothetical protein
VVLHGARADEQCIDDDGKISEQWAFEDFAAILSQVGG